MFDVGGEPVLQRRSAAVRRSLHASESHIWSAVRRRRHGVRDQSDRSLGTNWIRYPAADAARSGAPIILYVLRCIKDTFYPKLEKSSNSSRNNFGKITKKN